MARLRADARDTVQGQFTSTVPRYRASRNAWCSSYRKEVLDRYHAGRRTATRATSRTAAPASATMSERTLSQVSATITAASTASVISWLEVMASASTDV